MPHSAVITADIVNSTRIKRSAEEKLLEAIKLELMPYKFYFFRGDSFQIYLKDVPDSLRILLLCRAIAIRYSDTKRDILCDVRASLGIGKVETPVRTLASAKGEAFLLSGRAFDMLENRELRLAISINNNLAQLALEVIADYVNAIFARMTPKQAGVIAELLKGKSKTAVAALLKKSNSTISQYVASSRWPEISKLLTQFERLVREVAD